MGNSIASELKQLTTISHPQRWVSVGFHQNIEILRDTVTGQQVQQSYVHTDFKRTHQEEMEQYFYRNQQKGNIVTVVYADRIGSKDFCVGSDKYKVRTERICTRLSDLNNLTCSEALYILREALIGFESAYQHGKKAIITDQMIGITPKGHVKIWVNSHFADNRPQSYEIEIRGRPLVLAEHQIVQQVFMTVKQHTMAKQFPPKLMERTHQKMTFSEAVRVINTFAWEQDFEIAKRIVKRQNPESIINFHQKPLDYQRLETISTLPTQTISSAYSNTSQNIQSLPPNELKPVKRLQQIRQNILQPREIRDRIRPTSNTGQRKLSPTFIHPKILQPNNKRTMPHAVVNLQSRAIQLKQQTNQDISHGSICLKGEDSIHLIKCPLPTQEIMRINKPGPSQQIYKGNIPVKILQNSHHQRKSRSEGHLLNQTVMRRYNNHIPSAHHLLQHKNQLPLESLRRRSQFQSDYNTKQTRGQISNSEENNRLQNQVRHSKQKLQPKGFKPIESRRNLISFESKQIEARIFKPEFSFDPKFHIKPTIAISSNQRQVENFPGISVIDSYEASNKVINSHQTQHTQINSQDLTLSNYLVRNFTVEPVIQQQSPQSFLFKNVKMTKTVEVPGKDQEKIFIDGKVRYIQEQLKNITYLESNNNTPMKNSLKVSIKNPELAPFNQVTNEVKYEPDQVRTSNPCIEKQNSLGFIAN